MTTKYSSLGIYSVCVCLDWAAELTEYPIFSIRQMLLTLAVDSLANTLSNLKLLNGV